MKEEVYQFNYLLYGLGKTNKAVKDFFTSNNINYNLYIDDETKEVNLDVIDVIVKSPGIKPNTKLLEEARMKNILIISDLELFSWFYPDAKLIIVTGTNGKTSTCRLLSYILSKKDKCYLCGNIGIPLFSITSNKNFKNEFVIVEASSYMLDNTYTVKPYVYVILNIEEHHLNYHKTFDNYYHTKIKLIKNMKNGLIVFPNEHKFIEEFKKIEIPKIVFSWDYTNIGIKVKNNYVMLEDEILYKINQFPILPIHQLTNVMISSSVALMLGVKPSKIRKALEDIVYEKYRLQKVYDDFNTIIINDSKATNFSASKAALNSITDDSYNLFWLLGGSGPCNISKCLEELKNVDKLFLYGENKYEISNELNEFNIDYEIYDDLEDIMEKLYLIKKKKIILFSPASQSFDMFDNFEKRGEYFNQLIEKYWNR